MLTTVATLEDAVRSVLRYEAEFERLNELDPDVRADMLQTVTRAKSWFTFRRDRRWHAAPSKFAGCADMTAERYTAHRKGDFEPIQAYATTAALMRWADSVPLPDNHPARAALAKWAASRGCRLKVGSEVYLLMNSQSARTTPTQPEGAAMGESTLSSMETLFLDYVEGVASQLSPQALEELRRRIREI